MIKEIPLTVSTKRRCMCDLCFRTKEAFAERGTRYEGLFVCFDCDMSINEFLRLSGLALIHIECSQDDIDEDEW